jgi:hypothetical protein
MRKSQAATEYMIILAVVIIIALIVVGVMGGIPGIGAGARDRTSAAYWAQADIGIAAFSNSMTVSLDSVKVVNNLRSTITISQINFTETAANTTFTSAANILASSITLAAGQSRLISGVNINSSCSTIGSAWASSLKIKYTEAETGAIYYFTGDGNSLSGDCSS